VRPAIGRRFACRQKAVAQAETVLSIVGTHEPGLGAGGFADGQAREPPTEHLSTGLWDLQRLLHR
jgi:hypothetical protein